MHRVLWLMQQDKIFIQMSSHQNRLHPSSYSYICIYNYIYYIYIIIHIRISRGCRFPVFCTTIAFGGPKNPTYSVSCTSLTPTDRHLRSQGPHLTSLTAGFWRFAIPQKWMGDITPREKTVMKIPWYQNPAQSLFSPMPPQTHWTTLCKFLPIFQQMTDQNLPAKIVYWPQKRAQKTLAWRVRRQSAAFCGVCFRLRKKDVQGMPRDPAPTAPSFGFGFLQTSRCFLPFDVHLHTGQVLGKKMTGEWMVNGMQMECKWIFILMIYDDTNIF